MHALLLTALFLTAAPGTPAAAPAEGPALVDLVQAYYDKTPSLTSAFEQTSVRARTGRKKVRRGKVRVLRPDRLRWDYTHPDRVHYVASGDVLWAYQPADGIAYKMNVAGSDVDRAIRLLAGGVRIAEVFDASETQRPRGLKDEGLRYLSLAPKDNGEAFHTLVLGVTPDSGAVRLSVVVDREGNELQTRYAPKPDAPAPKPSVFEFEPPAGVRVEDLSKARGN